MHQQTVRVVVGLLALTFLASDAGRYINCYTVQCEYEYLFYFVCVAWSFKFLLLNVCGMLNGCVCVC